MDMLKKINKSFRKKLVLSLVEGGFRYDYYKIKTGADFIYVLDEYSRNWQPDYYSVFFSILGLLENLKKHESSSWLPLKNNWWSYCPHWIYLNPIFMDDEIKTCFSNEIANLLDGIGESDLSETEKYAFRLWMNACKISDDELQLVKTQ